MRWGLAMVALIAMFIGTPACAALDVNGAEVSHLANGLTVILLEDHSFPVISVQMLYKSGSAAEITGKTGLAHFMEHLAFRGSKNFPNERAAELIYDAGGEWHGYTAFDQTTYFATMPSNGLDLLLKIEADRMARTIIDPASIEAERGAVITELHSYENEPTSVLQDAVARTAIQVHPYGSPMAGYVSDVEHLTAEDARDYYASHYAPANAVLAIVGDIVPSQARAMVEKEFSGLPARPVAAARITNEPPQLGQRRIALSGPVDRQYFELAYPSPAASNADFAAFLVLQQILSGGDGVNLHQSDWSAAPSIRGSILFGATEDIATFLPPTRDPFLFTISGSIDLNGDRSMLERMVTERIARLRDQPMPPARIAQAKAAVVRELAEDVQTTADAAHQLAFFEGIGALGPLLSMRQRVDEVSATDVQRVARTYLATDQSTIGWMVQGTMPRSRAGEANPKQAGDRAGAPSPSHPAAQPQLRRLSSGLPAIVEVSPLSNSATVELLFNGPLTSGVRPQSLPGLDAVVESGTPEELQELVSRAAGAARPFALLPEQPSEDPAARLQQLLIRQIHPLPTNNPRPLAVIVSGKVDPNQVFALLDRTLGSTAPARIAATAPRTGRPSALRLISERIAKPLSQGAIGYVVEGPPSGTREALAWRLLLYVLTHDYAGRLGRSAITEKGIVYHIYSDYRTDGRRTWATIWTGVDPEKADAMEAELRTQLAKLESDPPSTAELEGARSHVLGRDLSAAQSNVQLTAKLARDFIELGEPRSHDRLRADLARFTPADLAAASHAFATGTIIRVDVGGETTMPGLWAQH